MKCRKETRWILHRLRRLPTLSPAPAAYLLPASLPSSRDPRRPPPRRPKASAAPPSEVGGTKPHTSRMDFSLPSRIEQLPRHRRRLMAACRVGANEPDVVGMAIAGSFVDGAPDTYSDLDLRVVLANGSFERLFARREEFARACGPLVAAFTGEHVGEPYLLITLYDDLVHVDFLFTELADAQARNEGRKVRMLWQREPGVTEALSRPYEPDPVADLAYSEARIWTWVWYIQSKILRGELWEAVSGLSFVRDQVLFRLLATSQEIRYRGARFAEESVGGHAATVARTLGKLDQQALLEALRTTVGLYLELADPLLERHNIKPADTARQAVMPALEAGLSWQPLKA
jgi:hypothetical protein